MRVSITINAQSGLYSMSTIADGEWIIMSGDEDPNYVEGLGEVGIMGVIAQLHLTKYDSFGDWYDKTHPLVGHYSDEGIAMRPQPIKPKSKPAPPTPSELETADKARVKKLLQRAFGHDPENSLAAIRARRGY